MGIAKSLRKVDYLSDVGNDLTNLANILEINRKKEEQKQFINTVVGLYNKWEQGQDKAKMKSDLKEGGQVTNVLSPDNVRGMTGEKPTGLNLKTNVPENIQTDLSKQPPMAPETQTREISPQERYMKSEENLSEFMKAIVPLIMNPDVDQNLMSKTNVLSGLASQETEKLRPKEPTYFELSPGEKQFKRDEKGVSEVASNPKLDTSEIEEYERDENGNYKVYNIEGQKYYNKLKKDAQGKKVGEELTRIPKSGEGGTTINMPENPPDISQQEKDLTKSWDNYEFYDKKTKDLAVELKKKQDEYKTASAENQKLIRARIDEINDELGKADEQKNIWFTDVKATTNQTANKLNSKMPGFEKIYNLLFQSPEVKSKDSKKIDKLVEREMEGASDDAKRWMKRLLKARAF